MNETVSNMEIAVLINAATSGPTPGLPDAVALAAEIKARFLLLVSSWIPGVFETFFCTPDDLGHWQRSETAERLTRWLKIGTSSRTKRIAAPSDFLNAGRAGAADIQSAIDYMTTQSFVLKDRVVVVGQSAGGWDTLALASQNPPWCG